MADRLKGYRILILETREEAQFSRLLTEQGADVLQCPMFTIHDAPDPAPIEAWIRRFVDKPCDDLVLMTGEGRRRIARNRTGAAGHHGEADFRWHRRNAVASRSEGPPRRAAALSRPEPQ